MIEHLVIFKWKPDTTESQIAAAHGALRGLKDSIPGIVSITCGSTISDRGQGYTTGLVVRLENKAALDAYGPHPAHQAVVANFISPIRENLIAIDYEVG